MVVTMTAANGWRDPSICVYLWAGRLKLAGLALLVRGAVSQHSALPEHLLYYSSRNIIGACKAPASCVGSCKATVYPPVGRRLWPQQIPALETNGRPAW